MSDSDKSTGSESERSTSNAKQPALSRFNLQQRLDEIESRSHRLRLPLEQESYRCHHCGVCVQCDECVKACPRHALRREGDRFILDEVLCGGCGTCAAACRGSVIQMVPR